MSQESLILVIGLFLMLLPSLAVPNAYDRWIIAFLGAVVAVIGYRLRRAAYLRSIETSHGERRADAYVESRADTLKGSV
jgi:uncharacterized membrane protein